ncbi:MAG: hypothetical protein EP315_07355 [Gammaproteobacteria bacterium]|nr:MAG: hypothetical protein EP315_07355 [Gammaproteobacteria bacterium]
MKKILMIWLLLLTPVTGHALEVTSSFGFKMTLPSYWIALTRDEVRENADMFDLDQVKDIPEPLLKQVVPMIREGRIELFFRPDGSTEFVDNVNVYKQIGSVADDSNITAICASLPKELEAAYQRPVTVYDCKLMTVNNLRMVYLEFDGLLAGTRNIQYQIPKSRNISIVFTVTFKTSSMKDVKAEVNQIIQSLKLL